MLFFSFHNFMLRGKSYKNNINIQRGREGESERASEHVCVSEWVGRCVNVCEGKK